MIFRVTTRYIATVQRTAIAGHEDVTGTAHDTAKARVIPGQI